MRLEGGEIREIYGYFARENWHLVHQMIKLH